MPDKLLDTRAVARRAGVGVSAIRHLRLKGRMPPALPDKVGQSHVWPESVIDAWLPVRAKPGRPAN